MIFVATKNGGQKISLSFGSIVGSRIRDPGTGMDKNQDPGSGMNIPDPQHQLLDRFAFQIISVGLTIG